jgi:hypothetical protein
METQRQTKMRSIVEHVRQRVAEGEIDADLLWAEVQQARGRGSSLGYIRKIMREALGREPVTPRMHQILDELADGQWHEWDIASEERGLYRVTHALARRGLVEFSSRGRTLRARLSRQTQDQGPDTPATDRLRSTI